MENLGRRKNGDVSHTPGNERPASRRIWKAIALAGVLHAGILSYGYPRIAHSLKTSQTIEEKMQEKPKTNSPLSLRELESIINRMEARDPSAFPSDGYSLFTSFVPADVPQHEIRKYDGIVKDRSGIGSKNEYTNQKGDQNKERNVVESKPMKLDPDPPTRTEADGSGPIPLNVLVMNPSVNESSNPLSSKYVTEPRTLPELKEARTAFISDLKADLLEDPQGKTKLNHMTFISFFVRSWYYNHAIAMLQEGKPPIAYPEAIYARFGRIMAIAKSRMKPEHTALQRDLIFHGTMIEHMKGYERSAGDIRFALIDGVINCDSSTMLATSGYSQLDPSIMINAYSDHIQSGAYHGNSPIVIENPEPGNPLYRYDRGFFVKPEKYVSDYLVHNGYVPLSDLPQEVRTWYNYTLPPFGKNKPPSGFMPFLEKSPASDKVDIQPPQSKPLFPNMPWQISAGNGGISNPEHPSSGSEQSPSKSSPDDTSQRIEPPQAEPSRAEVIKKIVEKVYKELEQPGIIDRTPAKLFLSEQPAWLFYQRDSLSKINNRMSNLLGHWKTIDAHIESQFGPTPFEALGVYDRKQPSKPFKIIPENRPVLPASVRDADPKTERIGLVEDLEFGISGSGQELALIRFPSGNLGEIGQNVLDNRVLIVGTSFKDQVKGLYLRNTAVERAKAFGHGSADLTALRDSRMAALGAIMRGGRAQGFETLFSSHYGYPEDPLIPLRDMEASKGRKGLSISAIEDLISFSGETAAVDAIMGYLGRMDLDLDRMRYGAIIMSLRPRLLDGRGYLDGKLLDMLGEKEKPIALRAAVAQSLYLSGSKDQRISDTLEGYLKTSPDIQREEVVLLVKTGLRRERAVAVIRQRFEKIQMDMAESYIRQEDTKGEPLPYAFDRTDAVRLVESFESLISIGYHGHTHLLIRTPTHGSDHHPIFAIPIGDTVRLLRRHMRSSLEFSHDMFWYLDLGTGSVFPGFVAASPYRKTLYRPSDLFARSVALQGTINALDSPVLGQNPSLYANSQVLLSKLLDDRPRKDRIPQRVSAALSFARLGHPDIARRILMNDINENIAQFLNLPNCTPDMPRFCDTGNDQNSYAPPMFSIAGANALSRLGMTEADMQRFKAGTYQILDNDPVQEIVGGKSPMCYSSNSNNPLSWLLPDPQDPFAVQRLRNYQDDDFIKATVESVLRLEALYRGLENLIHTRPDDVSILALYLKTCETAPSHDPIALRLIMANRQNIYQTITEWYYTPRLSSDAINYFVKRMGGGDSPALEISTSTLAAKGYLAIGKDGQVMFQNPPKPYRPLKGQIRVRQESSNPDSINAVNKKVRDDKMTEILIRAGLESQQTRPMQPKKLPTQNPTDNGKK